MEKVALIVAGGKGERMNSKTPKQFLPLNNMPILMYSILLFSDFDKILVALPKTQIKYWQNLCEKIGFNEKHIIVEGGSSRFNSVKNGLDKIKNNSIVAIHDGVRPLATKSLLNNLMSKTKKGFGIIPVIPIKDSMRRIDQGLSERIDRDNMFAVQTPQCFMSNDIKNAYQQDYNKNFTDDASVFENNGGEILSICGEAYNLKITEKKDLEIAEIFIK